jgi:hypothetical protein
MLHMNLLKAQTILSKSWGLLGAQVAGGIEPVGRSAFGQRRWSPETKLSSMRALSAAKDALVRTMIVLPSGSKHNPIYAGQQRHNNSGATPKAYQWPGRLTLACCTCCYQLFGRTTSDIFLPTLQLMSGCRAGLRFNQAGRADRIWFGRTVLPTGER